MTCPHPFGWLVWAFKVEYIPEGDFQIASKLYCPKCLEKKIVDLPIPESGGKIVDAPSPEEDRISKEQVKDVSLEGVLKKYKKDDVPANQL